jgi:polysaccharide deacetylase family protein (PEP-CTERM system associated)
MNFLTIDTEDWFHVSNYSEAIPRAHWERMEPRLPRNLNLILDILNQAQVKATFFVLGWIAERHPELVKEIAAQGHEIASHGYQHDLIYDLGPNGFRQDLQKSINLLNAITGSSVLGYRAPSFSITSECQWVFTILVEAGLKYDSSVYPLRRHRGGIPNTPNHPYQIDTSIGPIQEFPLSTLDIGLKRIPVGGGGFFRLYPYWLTAMGIRQLNRQGIPAVVYLHPWEFDPEQPYPEGSSWRQRWKHRVNLRRTEPRFRRLLQEFQFQPLYKGLQ